ncbi:MAG: hypothetical protein IT522_16565 [Burkholderiales bacterium]|nr:hypothetical protein [Burkholderiales bacterium]
MSPLQLALIAAGILLVAAVIVYNWWTLRAARRRASLPRPTAAAAVAAGQRVEPTLRVGDALAGTRKDATATSRTSPSTEGPDRFDLPQDVIEHDGPSPASDAATTAAPATPRGVPGDAAALRKPDPEIECIVTLQPAQAVGVGTVAAGLHARLGKRLRWFGRSEPNASWQALTADTRGEFVELVACLLLADRNGATSRAQLDSFVRVMNELAPHLPAAMSVPDVAAEAERAEALDRLCADVDVQVGLTILSGAAAGLSGTKLRGVAEAAGFHLAADGRFEWTNEDTGAVVCSLQNLRNEPFTAETLRGLATHGVVLVLDVPRVTDPPRAFDQMKLAAKRVAATLGAELVDDNRRPLDDSALAAIRGQVDAAVAALRQSGIEPGSARALALFGA